MVDIDESFKPGLLVSIVYFFMPYLISMLISAKYSQTKVEN